MLRDTLNTAFSKMAKFEGPDLSSWTWGRLHTVRFRHPLDQLPGAAEVMDLGPATRPGDEYTVNATGYFGGSYDQISGASYREILDTSNWDGSVAVNTPGQSGQPESTHYSDLMPLWRDGKYFPLVYSKPAVERETTDKLVMEPD
jgi:penicillin amidase